MARISLPRNSGWHGFQWVARISARISLLPRDGAIQIDLDYLGEMGRHDKLLLKILRGTSDSSIPFEGLRSLLQWLGFEERTTGSHHIFTKEDVAEILNLQRKGSSAKAYQVKQIRRVIVTYKLQGPRDET